MPTIRDCANACARESDMFLYGTTEWGNRRCYGSKGCACYCQYSTNDSNLCPTAKAHTGFNLYNYTTFRVKGDKNCFEFYNFHPNHPFELTLCV